MSETRTAQGNRAARAAAIKAEQARIAHADLAAVRARIAEIKHRRAETLARVRAHCKAERVRVREATKAKRRAERERIEAEIRAMRQAERNKCAARAYRVKHDAGELLEYERAELARERRQQRLNRRVELHRARELRKVTALERRRESDDEVRANIDPELLPIWERVKSKIRAPAGASRTEAFLHWLHENADEVWRIRGEHAEAELGALLKRERLAQREAAKHRRRPAKLARAELPAAPF